MSLLVTWLWRTCKKKGQILVIMTSRGSVVRKCWTFQGPLQDHLRRITPKPTVTLHIKSGLTQHKLITINYIYFNVSDVMPAMIQFPRPTMQSSSHTDNPPPAGQHVFNSHCQCVRDAQLLQHSTNKRAGRKHTQSVRRGEDTLRYQAPQTYPANICQLSDCPQKIPPGCDNEFRAAFLRNQDLFVCIGTLGHSVI